MMIATKPSPDVATAPIQWAVTSEITRATALVTDIEDAVIFDDLKAAFAAAREASEGCLLMVWGLTPTRAVIALAHDGDLFYGIGDDSVPAPVPPTNALRSAFPWAVVADGDFTMEPGISKREFFAAMAIQGLLSNWHDYTDWSAANAAADLADALLSRLGPTGNDEF